MSDHEIETIIWDDSDVENDVGKKSQHGIGNDVGKNTESTSCKIEDAIQKKEVALCHPSRNGSSEIPEISWTHASRKTIPASYVPECNSNRPGLVSHNDNWPNNFLEQHGLDTQNSTFCTENPIFGTVGVAEESKTCNLMSLADAGFTSAEYEPKGKENDLLYYDCPDICNFDDIDGMLRNCDSTFKQGSSNVNEISWFSSSSQGIFQPEDTWKSDLQSSVLESKSLEGTSMTYGAGTNLFSQNHSTMADNDKSASLACKSFMLVNDAETMGKSARVERAYDGIGVAEISPTLTQVGNANILKESEKQDLLKSQHSFKGNGEKHPSECASNISFHGPGHMQQTADQKHLSVFSIHQPYSSDLFKRQNNFWGFDSSSCKQITSPYAQFDDSLTPYQDLFMQNSSGAVSGMVNSASSSHEVAPCVTSHASRCIDKLLAPLSGTPVVIPDEMISEPCLKENSCAAWTVNHLLKPSMKTSTASVQKQHKFLEETRSENELEDVSFKVPAFEMTSSAVQEHSCMTSVSSDVISLEAIYFQQLQYVINQFVARTKLCIRDGLYRLAMSAEQTHNFANRNTCSRDTTGGILDKEKSKKCIGYMAVEAETNPIDRAIAHLLFHRPSELATRPTDHAMLVGSHIINGQILGPTQHQGCDA